MMKTACVTCAPAGVELWIGNIRRSSRVGTYKAVRKCGDLESGCRLPVMIHYLRVHILVISTVCQGAQRRGDCVNHSVEFLLSHFFVTKRSPDREKGTAGMGRQKKRIICPECQDSLKPN